MRSSLLSRFPVGDRLPRQDVLEQRVGSRLTTPLYPMAPPLQKILEFIENSPLFYQICPDTQALKMRFGLVFFFFWMDGINP